MLLHFFETLHFVLKSRMPHISLSALGLLLHMHRTQAPLCGCSHLTARQTCLDSLEPGIASDYQRKMHL